MRLFAIAVIMCAVGCASKQEPVAVVLGDRIFRDELKPEDASASLSQLIQEPIMRRYMREHSLGVSDKDLIAYLKKGEEPIPKAFLDRKGKAFFRSILESRLFAKSLFEKYSGRVAISSFGFADAVDARATFLREQAQTGTFVINDPVLREAFWKNATNEWLDATLTETEAREMFNTPGFPLETE